MRALSEERTYGSSVHGHYDFHVTRYCLPGEDMTRLMATHSHERNHPPVSRSHEPHEVPEKEHEREARVHDHTRPAASSA